MRYYIHKTCQKVDVKVNKSLIKIIKKQTKYEVTRKEKTGFYHHFLSMRPWLVYTIVNVVSFMTLVAIAFAVSMAISTACKCKLRLDVEFCS